MNQEERNALRTALRQSRNSLSPEQQQAAAHAIQSTILAQDFFQSAQRLAFYHHVDGEIDTSGLISTALTEGKSCFLPVIDSGQEEFMAFAPYTADTKLVENQWGIAEPPSPDTIGSPTELDVVFVPLVGFDEGCFRLGMGKGYYDRTFSFKIFNRGSKPLLIGLAHECQLTEPFPVASWDVRLDAVITDKKIYRPDTA
ncbi:MAG: 5-formyltetrahydrofolate cyclo-ligase [Gammaproteobacteria bacterium]